MNFLRQVRTDRKWTEMDMRSRSVKTDDALITMATPILRNQRRFFQFSVVALTTEVSSDFNILRSKNNIDVYTRLPICVSHDELFDD